MYGDFLLGFGEERVLLFFEGIGTSGSGFWICRLWDCFVQ